jgi:hypothetical protein
MSLDVPSNTGSGQCRHGAKGQWVRRQPKGTGMAAIRQKDLKLLWGRAASLCSMCRTELAYEGAATPAIPVGEQAHIVAEDVNGPRGESLLTPEQRNSYPNLILLCPTCHTKIDKAPDDHPVELLHHRKVEHELWVREQLTSRPETDVSTQLYSHLVDAVVMAASLDRWADWTSFALSPDAQWPKDVADHVFDLGRRIQTAIWPGRLQELERSLRTFALTYGAAFQVFSEHCHEDGEWLRLDRFYKISEWDEKRYHRLHDEFKTWQRACNDLLREATRAANWLADTVRQTLNPGFFLLHGKFSLVEGPYSADLSFYSTVYEYDPGVADTLPDALDARLAELAPSFFSHDRKEA